MPYTALSLIGASLFMIGLPPGAGFVSKWYLILAAIDAGKYVFVAIIFISTLLMLVYFWRIIEIMYIQPGHSNAIKELKFEELEKPQEVPASMMIPCAGMAVLTLLMGIIWISGILRPLHKALAGTGMSFFMRCVDPDI